MHVRIKRAFEAAAPEDGKRILIDRLWPRGLSKERAHIDWWCKAIAPSPELRIWFGHDPAKYDEFTIRYERELQANAATQQLLQELAAGPATLIYAKRDTAHSHALVLQRYLEKQS